MYRSFACYLAVSALAACRPTVKAPVHDTFTKVGGADQILALGYGAASQVVKTRGTTAGSNSTDGAATRSPSTSSRATATRWCSSRRLRRCRGGSNDDADALTSDSHLTTSLPAERQRLIAFRGFSFAPASFTVATARHAARGRRRQRSLSRFRDLRLRPNPRTSARHRRDRRRHSRRRSPPPTRRESSPASASHSRSRRRWRAPAPDLCASA